MYHCEYIYENLRNMTHLFNVHFWPLVTKAFKKYGTCDLFFRGVLVLWEAIDTS